MQDLQKLGEILDKLYQAAEQEGLDPEPDVEVHMPLGTPPDIWRHSSVKQLYVYGDHAGDPFIVADLTAQIRISKQAWNKWYRACRRGEGFALEAGQLIEKYKPGVKDPKLTITLTTSTTVKKTRAHKDRFRYVIGVDGLVTASEKFYVVVPAVNYVDFTGKGYETVFEHVISEFKRLAGR